MRVTRVFKWILRFIFNTALALLFCLALVLLIPRFFGIAPYVVLSGSMEPRISTGSLVFADTREREPEIGDVITYQVDGQNVTHRVVRTENGACITKGDANTQEDLIPVSPSQIIGRVIFTLPYLGFGVALLRRKVVFSAMVLLAVLSSLLNYAYSPGKELNKQNKNQKREESL